MGSYSNNLSRRLRHSIAAAPHGERLIAVAIMRNGEVLTRGFRSHYELRQAINPNDDPRYGKPGDIDGFFTSSGRFVTRREAQPIAVAAGQLREEMRRDLLSSDLNW